MYLLGFNDRSPRISFGRDVDRKMPSNKSVTLLELMGTESNGSLYFQSSALPTELPGLGNGSAY